MATMDEAAADRRSGVCGVGVGGAATAALGLKKSGQLFGVTINIQYTRVQSRFFSD